MTFIRRTIKGVLLLALLNTSCQYERSNISNTIKENGIIEASYYSQKKIDVYPLSQPATDEKAKEGWGGINNLSGLVSEDEMLKTTSEESKSVWDDYAPKPFSIEAEHLSNLSYDIRKRINEASGLKINESWEIRLYEDRSLRRSIRIGIDPFNPSGSLIYLEIKY